MTLGEELRKVLKDTAFTCLMVYLLESPFLYWVIKAFVYFFNNEYMLFNDRVWKPITLLLVYLVLGALPLIIPTIIVLVDYVVEKIK